ncbi:MAG: NAD-dependent epimerase/dehydratase family protein [Pseudomonadota bacterium]
MSQHQRPARTVLVTGGGGFVGQAVCRQLAARGDRPIAFQRGAGEALDGTGIAVRQGDIREAADVTAAMAGCDAVIHTAGKAGPWGDPELYHAINVTGTKHVIAACRTHGIGELVFTSSPSVAHGGGDIEGADESLPYPTEYAAAYPETKAAAEQLVMAASDDRLATVSLRPHLVWGPGDNHLLPRLVQKAQGGTLKLPGADKLIDTVYVDNAARAHLQALDALGTNPPCHGKTYFISNDEPVPQADIIRDLLSAVGVNVRIRPISPKAAMVAGSLAEWWWKRQGLKSEPPVTRWAAEQLSTAHWYDISAAKRDLGYRPEISIRDGLERLRVSNRDR